MGGGGEGKAFQNGILASYVSYGAQRPARQRVSTWEKSKVSSLLTDQPLSVVVLEAVGQRHQWCDPW